jgi:hypothetical protein
MYASDDIGNMIIGAAVTVLLVGGCCAARRVGDDAMNILRNRG